MRVISGQFRGRKLRGPLGMEMRPTGDRLKETLFNILGSSIVGAVVLDVFSGTGAVGIEALSRGADKVVFVENAAEGNRLIRKNLRLCGVEGGYCILAQDAFKAMRFLVRREFKADIVFFDPPYKWKPYHDLLQITFERGLISQPSSVVIEHHRKADLPGSGKSYKRSRIVQQGNHCLSFYEPLRF